MKASAPLRTEVHRDTGPALEALVPQWDALARRLGCGFAAKPSYALSWWRHLGAGQLHVVAGWRGDALVAVVPLHRRVLAGQPVWRWLGHGLGTVGSMLAEDEGTAEAVWDELAGAGTALQLTHVRCDDLSAMALRRSARWRHRLVVDDRCLTMVLPPGATARSMRSHSSFRRLANYRRGLEREGREFSTQMVTSPEGLAAVWPQIVTVAEQADRDRDRNNLCAPPYAGFTYDVLLAEARAGALLIVGGLLGGQWVAHELAVRRGQTLDLWLSRFDPAVARFSVGHLVMQNMVDSREDLDVEGCDFGIGENAYKRAWANGGYDIGTLTAVPAAGSAATTALVRGRLGLAGAAGSAKRRLRR